MPESSGARERRREYDRRRAKAKNKAYYAKNKEREAARCKAFREANADLVREIKKAWRERNAEHARAYAKAYRYSDHTAALERERQWREANGSAEKGRRWRELNAEREKERLARWARENRPRMRQKNAERRARKLRATPAWADHGAIHGYYEEAVRLTAETGIPHEVDHIVPLKGANVCGLHVQCNLRVVTRTVNRSKNNRMVEDECKSSGSPLPEHHSSVRRCNP